MRSQNWYCDELDKKQEGKLYYRRKSMFGSQVWSEERRGNEKPNFVTPLLVVSPSVAPWSLFPFYIHYIPRLRPEYHTIVIF